MFPLCPINNNFNTKSLRLPFLLRWWWRSSRSEPMVACLVIRFRRKRVVLKISQRWWQDVVPELTFYRGFEVLAGPIWSEIHSPSLCQCQSFYSNNMSRNNLTTAIILHHGLGSIWHLPFFSSLVLSMILDHVQSFNDDYAHIWYYDHQNRRSSQFLISNFVYITAFRWENIAFNCIPSKNKN